LLAHPLEPDLQRGGITMDLFRCGGWKLPRNRIAFEQVVLRGHDVFDRGGILGFLQGQRVDQDRFVRDCRRGSFELRQGAVGSCGEAEYCGRFECDRLRDRKRLEGAPLG